MAAVRTPPIRDMMRQMMAGAAIAVTASIVCGPARAADKTGDPKEKTVSEYKKPSEAELRKRLTPEQFAVVCNADTEPAFQNAFWNNHEPGIYADIASGEPLFSSLDKFDSGGGSARFSHPIEPANIVSQTH